MFVAKILVATVILVSLTVSASSIVSIQRTSEQVLQNFYSYNGPEITLMDPLILAGDAVVPAVIEKVKDKKMPKRRYAITFLGNGSYKQALPVLEEIVQDQTEDPLIRGDALQALYLINNELGLQYAQRYKEEQSYLGVISRDLLNNKQLLPEHRSYIDALLSSIML